MYQAPANQFQIFIPVPADHTPLPGWFCSFFMRTDRWASERVLRGPRERKKMENLYEFRSFAEQAMAITSQPGVYPSIGEEGMKVMIQWCWFDFDSLGGRKHIKIFPSASLEKIIHYTSKYLFIFKKGVQIHQEKKFLQLIIVLFFAPDDPELCWWSWSAQQSRPHPGLWTWIIWT